jgi:hypothetical protein
VLSRFWTSTAALTLAISLASGAAAQETSTAEASATTTIEDSASIAVTGDVIFQDIILSPQMSSTSMLTSSSGSGTSVTLGGGDAVSLAVPESFDLTSEDGVETLTVQLMSNGDYSALDHLRSVVINGDALSIDISGTIRVDKSQLQPGEYRGLLVVVAQYN